MSTQPCGCDPEAGHVCQVHEAVERLHLPYLKKEARNQKEMERQEKASLANSARNIAIHRDDAERLLREAHPHGHPEFLPITLKELDLHSRKNNDYAAGGDALGNFNRVAAILANYPDLKLSDPRVVALVYALKQLDAVLWGINANVQHKVEGLSERLQDISVYTKIMMCMEADRKKEGK